MTGVTDLNRIVSILRCSLDRAEFDVTVSSIMRSYRECALADHSCDSVASDATERCRIDTLYCAKLLPSFSK